MARMPAPAQEFQPTQALASHSEHPGLLEREDLQLAGLTLIVKLAVLAFGVFAVMVIAGQPLGPGLRGILQIWNHWDGPHYLDLAVLGYRSTDPGVQLIDRYQRAFPGDLPLYIVFFPLFPFVTLSGLVDEGYSERHPHQWAGPVTFAVTGLVFIGLALFLARRSRPPLAEI